MTQTVLTKHALERLAQTNPEAEIWWDSSPLIYSNWKQETLAKDPSPATSGWADQLTRFLDQEPAVLHAVARGGLVGGLTAGTAANGQSRNRLRPSLLAR